MPRVLVQFLTVLAFAMLLFMLWDFSQRVGTTMRLRQKDQELDQQVLQAEATQTALVAQKTRVQSDAFIEDYVRRNWHWARDGEVVVIAQVTPATTPPASVPSPTPTPAASSWWQDLLNFLFGP